MRSSFGSSLFYDFTKWLCSSSQALRLPSPPPSITGAFCSSSLLYLSIFSTGVYLTGYFLLAEESGLFLPLAPFLPGLLRKVSPSIFCTFGSGFLLLFLSLPTCTVLDFGSFSPDPCIDSQRLGLFFFFPTYIAFLFAHFEASCAFCMLFLRLLRLLLRLALLLGAFVLLLSLGCLVKT